LENDFDLYNILKDKKWGYWDCRRKQHQ